MKDYPLHKKIIAFGFALFFISFPLYIIFDMEYDKPLDLETDHGIVTLLFITSIVLMLVGFILSKIKRK